MTLHEAIKKLLQQYKQPMTTKEIASELNKNKWYQKKDRSQITPIQIYRRTRNYPNLFDLDGSTVFIIEISPRLLGNTSKNPIDKLKATRNKNSDETYVIDLCDKILGIKASRQHKFDFLKGDPNSQGNSVKLPVDAYYKDLKLVVEYLERQHIEQVRFFDKPNKLTVSGVNRGEQKKLYDKRRREVLPRHGIRLVEISYKDFKHDKQKRIIRDKNYDLEVVRQKLEKKQ